MHPNRSELLRKSSKTFAKKQFFFRPQDIEPQQEFLSYPKGKHDDVMDSVWTALDGVKPCRLKEFDANAENKPLRKKLLDWMTM